jgi:HK97 family phage portal protein
VQFAGLTVARTKAIELKVKAMTAAALSSVPGSRGWWPLIRELSTGGWQRNEDIAVDTVLSNPTLYACVTLIARDIGKLRPKLVEQDANGIWTEISSAAFSPVLRKPNHFQTRIEFFQWWLISKLVHGNTYALKARDGRNVVSALYILDPTRVRVLVATDGSVFYELHIDELSRVTQPLVVPAREIIHDKSEPLFHPLVGVSPIYAAGWPAMQGLNIRRTSDQFFTNGSKPGGVLSAPGEIKPETASRLSTYWQDNFSGDNIGKIAVLGDGLKYEQMAMTAEQSELVAQLNLTDEDICKAFHMPRFKVGTGPDPTYNNAEILNQIYYSDCLQKPIEELELLLDEGLELTTVPGRTLGVEFDLSDLIRMDSSSRMAFAKEGISSAILSPNEARRLFDMPPVTGGESPMLQQQMFSLEALAERDEAKPFAKPAEPPPATAPDDVPDDTTDVPAASEDAEKSLTLAEWVPIREWMAKDLRT